MSDERRAVGYDDVVDALGEAVGMLRRFCPTSVLELEDFRLVEATLAAARPIAAGCLLSDANVRAALAVERLQTWIQEQHVGRASAERGAPPTWDDVDAAPRVELSLTMGQSTILVDDNVVWDDQTGATEFERAFERIYRSAGMPLQALPPGATLSDVAAYTKELDERAAASRKKHQDEKNRKYAEQYGAQPLPLPPAHVDFTVTAKELHQARAEQERDVTEVLAATVVVAVPQENDWNGLVALADAARRALNLLVQRGEPGDHDVCRALAENPLLSPALREELRGACYDWRTRRGIV